MYSVCEDLTAGFPHSEICGSKLVCQLPAAYRRLQRPSSPVIAKASTMCTYSLVPITLTSALARSKDVIKNLSLAFAVSKEDSHLLLENSLIHVDDCCNHNPPVITFALITNASALTDKSLLLLPDC